ncbi:MAG: sigma-70 family RNA polymerase sigma factor [Planctomycetales bacterium]|nr:sigma-70 family RNA polymerase sigma factor [Planctomycetales bacterium]
MNDSSAEFGHLIFMAQRGCRLSQGRLLERYRGYLKALVRIQLHRTLSSRIDASDVVQETFIIAFTKIEQFRGQTEQQFVAWLRSILASRLAKVIRFHSAQCRNPDAEDHLRQSLDRSSEMMEGVTIRSGSSPSAVVCRHETVTLVAAAIEELPEDYRAVILLHHVEGLSHADVAKALERTVDSVKKLWLRALAQLQQIVEQKI